MLPEKGRSQNGDILGLSDGVAAGQSVRAMARPIRIQLLRPVFSPYFLPLCHPKLSAQLPPSKANVPASPNIVTAASRSPETGVRRESRTPPTPPNRQSASQLEGRLAWRHAQARLHPFVGMLGNRPQIVRREQPVFPCCQFEHRRIIGAFESDGGRQRVIKMGSRTQPPSQDCGGSGPRQPRMTRMTRMTRIE